jgi:bifunctional DNA-binding transcriptional regulator/antitoxin component of YhaV-PrlF toxin-antitoxin module
MRAVVGPKRYAFVTPLMRVDREYHVVVPARVSKSIAVRGRIPVIARVGRAPEFRGTLMPRGGGRHFLTVNGETRRAARIEPGDRVRVVVQPDFGPREVVIPDDLALALREQDVTADWESQPPGKREHIVKWTEKAVHPRRGRGPRSSREARGPRVASHSRVIVRAYAAIGMLNRRLPPALPASRLEG